VRSRRHAGWRERAQAKRAGRLPPRKPRGRRGAAPTPATDAGTALAGGAEPAELAPRPGWSADGGELARTASEVAAAARLRVAVRAGSCGETSRRLRDSQRLWQRGSRGRRGEMSSPPSGMSAYGGGCPKVSSELAAAGMALQVAARQEGAAQLRPRGNSCCGAASATGGSRGSCATAWTAGRGSRAAGRRAVQA